MPPLQTRGDGVSIPATNQVVIATTIDVLDDDGFNIGFVQQITRNDNRPTERIRHLDSVDAGRVIEQAPKPEDNTINMVAFALYAIGADRRSLINRIVGAVGGPFRSLNSQHIPFSITERWTQPATSIPSQTLYGDCYLTSYSRPVNIGTITIAETASANVTYVE